jgi:hypothetical protein
MKTAIAIFCACALSAQGASYFVRPTAQGSATGADWNNAWPLQGISWGSVAAGDSIFVAGGTYTNALSIGASGTAANRIRILRVKATDSAATSAAGWNSAFDSQVVITNPVVSANTFIGVRWANEVGNYVTIDGREADGISLRVSDQDTPSDSWQASICAWFNTPMYDVELLNIDFASVGGDSGYPFVGASTGIYVNGSGIKSNVVVRGCTFRDMVQAVQFGTAAVNWTFRSNSFKNTFPTTPPSNPLQHDNVIWAQATTNIVFAYNKVRRWATECFLLTGTGNGRWDIYGNVFYDSEGTGRIIETQADNNPVYFYNNTCVNVPGGIRYFSGTSTVYATNNIFNSVGQIDSTTTGNNLTNVATSLFVSYASRDLRLASATAAGAALASEYNIDLLGVTRGADGVWDIGAYEFGGEVVDPPDPPAGTNSSGTIYVGTLILR